MAKDNKPATITPEEKARLAIFNQMNEPTQKVAISIQENLKIQNSGIILARYQIGEELREIEANEAKFTANATNLLASYLDIPNGLTTLYELRRFATLFSREYVEEMTNKEIARGRYMSYQHWINLTKLADEKEIKATIDKIFKTGMGAHELEQEIRAGIHGKKNKIRKGGRRMKVPTNVAVAMQKAYNEALRFSNYTEAIDPLFDTISTMSPDNVSQPLLEQLTAAKDQYEKAAALAEKNLPRLTEAIARITRVVGTKEKAKTKDASTKVDKADKPEKAKPEKTAKAEKSAKSEKGKTEKSKDTEPARAARRPKAATV